MRKTTPLDVSEEDRALLLSWLGSPRLSARIRLRARVVVASAGGQGARALARDLSVSLETIYLWRKRYAEQGIDGLRSLALPGRRTQIDGRRARAILRAGRARRAGAGAASVAAVARASGVSRSTVRRLWEQHGLAVVSVDGRGRAPRPPAIGAGSIVGIYIDPPWRMLARVAPVGARPGVRSARARRIERGAGGPSAANALLTALEAFGGDPWTRRPPRLDELLSRLPSFGSDTGVEILAGPRPRSARQNAGAPTDRDTPIHLVHTRTRGAWLARAADWLGAASETQEIALAGVFGHLMDYFAGWRDGSGPFIWTPHEPPAVRRV